MKFKRQNGLGLITMICFLLCVQLHGQEAKPLIVASASIMADMAENLVGDLAEVQTIVPIGGDPHIYEPRPSDVQLCSRADLIVQNGLTFEGWLKKLIDNSSTKAEIVVLTEGITAITSATYTNAPDPHAWMNPRNGLIYIENLNRALQKLLPKDADIIQSNYEIYKKELELLDAYIAKRWLEVPKTQRLLITSHDAFQYYGRAYNIQVEAILGTSTDAQAQTSDIYRIDELIKKNHIPAVFIESTVNPKQLEMLAKSNKIKIGGKLYSDSIGVKGSKGDSYLNMLKANTDSIVEALTQKPADITGSEPTNQNNNFYFTIALAALLLVLVGIWVKRFFS